MYGAWCSGPLGGACVGGLSAVNAIYTQLHDLIKLGTDPMVVSGINKCNPVSWHQIEPEFGE